MVTIAMGTVSSTGALCDDLFFAYPPIGLPKLARVVEARPGVVVTAPRRRSLGARILARSDGVAVRGEDVMRMLATALLVLVLSSG